jgi:hypothetical protein
MTIRQLFYQLVGSEDILMQNCESEYRKVSRLMTIARKDGRIGFDQIVDRSRPEYTPILFENPHEAMHVLCARYRKDYWQDQPQRCEVWTEKDAMIGSFVQVTDFLGVTARATRGFHSTTGVYDTAQLIKSSPKPMTLFYLGDHDPAGRRMDPNLWKRLTEYGAQFKLIRMAIHKQDIATFKLPQQKVKDSDPNTPAFLREFGPGCVELDALPPMEVRRRVYDAIMRLVDREAWNHSIKVEKEERQRLVYFTRQWK